MKLYPNSNGYMQFCFYTDTGILYLKVPTFYDSTKKEWSACVHLNKSKKMIFTKGKDYKELEQNFSDHLKEFLNRNEDIYNFEDLRKKYNKEYVEICNKIKELIKNNIEISRTPLMSEILIVIGISACRSAAPTEEIADKWISGCVESVNNFFKKNKEESDIIKDLLKDMYKKDSKND